MREHTWYRVYFSLLLCISAMSDAADPTSGTLPSPAFEEEARKLNQTIHELKENLRKKFEEAALLQQKPAPEEELAALSSAIQEVRKQIFQAETQWRKVCSKDLLKEEEGYAFWDQGETTLSQMIMEYGAADHLYIIPPELGAMKLHMFSRIPIPRESWGEMIELVLSQNGIGIRKLNSYLRQLFILKQDLSHPEYIIRSKEELSFLPDQSWVFYILSPPLEQIQETMAFFERFSDLKQALVQPVGDKLVVVATKETLEKLISLYDSIWEKRQSKIIRVLSLKKMGGAEAEKVLQVFFCEEGKGRGAHSDQELAFFLLPQTSSLVLVGELPLIQRAEKMLNDLESQMESPEEMVVFWYTCRHSNPQDLAAILNQVYTSLGGAAMEKKVFPSEKRELAEGARAALEAKPSPSLPVAPSSVEPGNVEKHPSMVATGSFIVDPKTGSLLMVVRRNELDKLKSLLKKLDVPKKMVQIEVLLVERKLCDRQQTGINLLKIGDDAAKKGNYSSLSFDTDNKSEKKGILDFILSRVGKSHLPAFDLAFNFLMAQQDLRINANPSVITVNQTPAKISIVEELSINNGAVQIDSSKPNALEKSFTRAQFGITIVMTPTIHFSEDQEGAQEKGFVTLHTNVTFDTTEFSRDDRPPVTRRHVENEVCVADGETIILGGLRKRAGEESSEKIPFIGEIPGLGKLFGTSKLSDNSTEMFIFITPHIIHDLVDDTQRVKHQLLEKRPGDLPELLDRLEEAKTKEKKRLIKNSLKLLFGQK